MKSYGGLRGLAEQPIWLIQFVAKAFFTDDEGRLILEYVTHRKPEAE